MRFANIPNSIRRCRLADYGIGYGGGNHFLMNPIVMEPIRPMTAGMIDIDAVSNYGGVVSLMANVGEAAARLGIGNAQELAQTTNVISGWGTRLGSVGVGISVLQAWHDNKIGDITHRNQHITDATVNGILTVASAFAPYIAVTLGVAVAPLSLGILGIGIGYGIYSTFIRK